MAEQIGQDGTEYQPLTSNVRRRKRRRVNQPVLDIFVAAAESIVPAPTTSKPDAYATWMSTREDEFFNAESSARFLRRAGTTVDDSLLQQYAQVNRRSDPVDLRGITLVAPWIACLNVPFIDYSSFRKFREPPRYEGILTFTTPAISAPGDVAFFELWTEDGTYAQMGSWQWVQMRCKHGIQRHVVA
jgi:hypothetical protein